MCLFHIGFILTIYNSRGAFTARVLSSMIERVGLLNPGLEGLVDGAWSIYSAWEYAAQPSQPDYTTTLVDEFKNTFTRTIPVGIEFMGLFDTVNSVGLLRDRMFPFTTRFNLVKQIRHAVSIDERRTKYKQNLIYPYSYKPHIFSLECTPVPQSRITGSHEQGSNYGSLEDNSGQYNEEIGAARKLMNDIQERLNVIVSENIRNGRHTASVTSSSLEYDKSKLMSGEFQEIWFAGNHGDVGGGWAPSVNGQFLSILPLRWMLGEALGTGVLFQKEELRKFSERYTTLDSLLSPYHDLLSFKSNGLTLEISEEEKAMILKISNRLFKKSEVPLFRSCETSSNTSYTNLFTSGLYTTNLKRIGADTNDELLVGPVFQVHRDVPETPIQGFDGRGNSSRLRTLFWWMVELLPLGTKIENSAGEWKNVYIPNLGRHRSLPAYAQLHWSVYWRMRYTEDYHPPNLPLYAKRVYRGEDPVDQDDSNCLLKKAIEHTLAQFKKWDSEGWSIIPDDLSAALKEAGYYDSLENDQNEAGPSNHQLIS